MKSKICVVFYFETLIYSFMHAAVNFAIESKSNNLFLTTLTLRAIYDKLMVSQRYIIIPIKTLQTSLYRLTQQTWQCKTRCTTATDKYHL